MDMVQPLTWPEALTARAERPELLPIAGGTDVMVDINFDRRRPAGLLDLTRVPELATWSVADGSLRIGAGVT
jgi:CO/xanthine dehydrogenase FAD-binding subunit